MSSQTGTAASSPPPLTTWVLRDNLRLFLERVSGFIGYRFDESDWDAVRLGVREASASQNRRYDFTLFGESNANFVFEAAEDGRRVVVFVEAQEAVLIKTGAFARVMQCYEEESTAALEILAQAAFLESLEPYRGKVVSCTKKHLAICLECQEAQAYFSGKRWIDLIHGSEPLPIHWAYPVFLTPEAQRYFFPAYLVCALRDRDAEILDAGLNNSGRGEWTPLQQELIDFATYLLS
jgi:hypothetical protein